MMSSLALIIIITFGIGIGILACIVAYMCCLKRERAYITSVVIRHEIAEATKKFVLKRRAEK